jgi:multidrug efflux pump subunit AcrA (membrane-fusion protein)
MFPGLFAAVRIPLGPPKPGLLLPESAVLSDQEGDFVFVVNAGDIVERRGVIKGPLQGTDRAIKEGIASADRIVINGIPNIRVGEKVQIMNPANVATPGSAGSH